VAWESFSLFAHFYSHQPPSQDTNELDDLDSDAYSDLPALEPGRNANKKKKKKKKSKKRVRGPGLLSSLRDACMATNQALASSRLVSLVYDNLNLMNRIAEQIIGRKSASFLFVNYSDTHHGI
jgi:hypothetical protein